MRACLRNCGFQDVPIGLRGTEISTKNFSQGVLITCIYQLVAAKIVMRDRLAEEGMRGGYSPISIAQIPVPAPMSRTFTGASFGSGQKCSLLSMTILIIWWNRSNRSNSNCFKSALSHGLRVLWGGCSHHHWA